MQAGSYDILPVTRYSFLVVPWLRHELRVLELESSEDACLPAEAGSNFARHSLLACPAKGGSARMVWGKYWV